jgi:hypothetical protein
MVLMGQKFQRGALWRHEVEVRPPAPHNPDKAAPDVQVPRLICCGGSRVRWLWSQVENPGLPRFSALPLLRDPGRQGCHAVCQQTFKFLQGSSSQRQGLRARPGCDGI